MAYTTKSGDTWDVIAKQVYGSEYHADILMAANPQQIDTFLFEAGVVLATPVFGGGARRTAATVEVRGKL